MTNDRRPCVYILASRRNGTFYVGVTNNVARRVSENYGVHLLAYVEFHDAMENAILREKHIKRWKRVWKLELIERENPHWRDLYTDLSL